MGVLTPSSGDLGTASGAHYSASVTLPPPEDPTPSTPGVPAGWYQDPTNGRLRWWNGIAWTNDFYPPATAAPAYAPPATGYGAVAYGSGQRPTNGFAVAALVLGIVGFVLTPIPFGIGLFFGAIPALLGVIFGIVGIVRANRVRVGMPPAIIGLCLGGIMVLLVPLGAGTLW